MSEPTERVLIADDDDTSRVILEAMLTTWSFDVVTTLNGEAAWSEIQRDDAPRLLLLDWMMPGVDGLELCRRTRGLAQNQRYIILLTARDRREDVVAGLEQGADDYLVKPFDRDELRARLRVGERMLALHRELEARIEALEAAQAHVRKLQGIIPICMYCKRIRTEEDAWVGIERYMQEQTDAKLSHGICASCAEDGGLDR